MLISHFSYEVTKFLRKTARFLCYDREVKITRKVVADYENSSEKLFLFSMILWLVEFLITRISDSFPGATPLFVVICLIQGILLLISVLLFLLSAIISQEKQLEQIQQISETEKWHVLAFRTCHF